MNFETVLVRYKCRLYSSYKTFAWRLKELKNKDMSLVAMHVTSPVSIYLTSKGLVTIPFLAKQTVYIWRISHFHYLSIFHTTRKNNQD